MSASNDEEGTSRPRTPIKEDESSSANDAGEQAADDAARHAAQPTQDGNATPMDGNAEGEETSASLQSFLNESGGPGGADEMEVGTPATTAAAEAEEADTEPATEEEATTAGDSADFEPDFSALAISSAATSAFSGGTAASGASGSAGASRSADSSALDQLTATSDAFLSTASRKRSSGGSSASGSARKEHNGGDSGPSSNGPTPQQSPLSLRPSSRQGSASKLPSLNAPSSQASSAPAAPPRLIASSSADNLFSSDLSPSSAAVASASASATNAAQPKTVTRRIFSMFNPFGSSSPSAAPAASPSPPPAHAGLNAATPAAAVTSGPVAPSTPLPPSSAANAAATPTAAASSAAPPSTPSVGISSSGQSSTPPAIVLPASFGVPVVPRSYTYQDFAAKMKLPGAQDLVRTLKTYVKSVQAPDWLARHAAHPDVAVARTSTVFDRVKSEYNEVISGILRLIRHKHPLWKGSSEEEIDNSLESIEKFLTSKLYDKFFWNLFPEDKVQDQLLADRLFVLHTWVRPAHFDLPAYCSTDVSVWDHPAEELRNMDKFKSPRDKLVCLLNCCHIINNILKRAKLKANAEKAEAAEARRRAREKARQERERERAEKNAQDEQNAANAASAAAAAGTAGVISSPAAASSTEASSVSVSVPLGASLSSRRSSLAVDDGDGDGDGPLPSSSPSADDFFPALIYTLIHARPPHLHLNLVYISLCRYESKLAGGEAAYWYTNLASAIQFIQGCNAKSFSFATTTTATTAAASAAAGPPGGAETAAVPGEPAASHRKSSSSATAASAAAAEEARLEYERLMARGETLLREQREREAAEAEAARLAQEEQARKDEAAAVAAAAAAAIDAAKHQEEAEAAAVAADAAAFMAAAAADITVMPSPPPQPAPLAVSTPAIASTPVLASAPSAQPAAAAATTTTGATGAAGVTAAVPATAASVSHAALSHNHGPSSWTSSGLPLPSPLPSPCLACLQLSHRRLAPRFLEREFSTLRVSELQDVLREYKEMCFLLQGWQDHAAHRDLRAMPLPPRPSRDADDAEGVALTGSDANSAAPSSAHVAGLSAGTGGAAQAAPTAAATSSLPAAAAAAPSAIPRGWPLTNFLGLGRTK